MTISLDAGLKKFKEIKEEKWKLFGDSIVDATGMLIATTPFFAAFETLVPKYLGATESIISKYLAFPELMPSDSFDARIKTIGAMYFGFGLLFSKTRDASRAMFDIRKDSSGFIKKFHDGVYAATIGIPAALLLYYSNGDLNNLEVFQGVVSSTIASFGLGTVSGLGIDYARDLMQNIKSVRVPDKISNMPKVLKYSIVGVSAITSAVLTEGVYRVRDYIDSKKEIKTKNLESKINDNKTYDATNDFCIPLNNEKYNFRNI